MFVCFLLDFTFFSRFFADIDLLIQFNVCLPLHTRFRTRLFAGAMQRFKFCTLFPENIKDAFMEFKTSVLLFQSQGPLLVHQFRVNVLGKSAL